MQVSDVVEIMNHWPPLLTEFSLEDYNFLRHRHGAMRYQAT